ncbi:hypothetical protein [Piscinibacter sp. HJYY11]|uniref:hypothetical protein n=1 Tax=Piscinibacter sp. HJYY11 TaxID=2801333 RepID=UPI00191E6D9D|nr:hypothetical protein [Piscinibacter sp. HJYY11]MBL0728199.1 hypothetical protein [Piscinibacter sp. HJYY11]
MATIPTHVHLQPAQREFLEKQAKLRGTNVSAEVRASIDLYRAGVESVAELELLDVATRKAKDDLDATLATLDAGQRRAKAFFAEIDSIKAGSST